MSISAEVRQDAMKPMSPTQRAAGEPEFQIANVWRILRRHTLLILGLALLGAVLGIAFSLLSPRLYSATATIEVSPQGDSPVAANSLAGVHENFANNDEMDASLLTEQSEVESGLRSSVPICPTQAGHARCGVPPA